MRERGRAAWGRIKATAAEQRELWRQVGEALLAGRRKNPSNQAFSRWCSDNGFDMDPSDRSNAMWFASYDGHKIPTDLSHPTRIRQWFRDQESSRAPSPDLDLSASPKPVLTRIATVAPIATKVLKLAAHAEGAGPEAETARRYLKKQADAKGLTADELVGTARALEPQVAPADAEAQAQARHGLFESVHGLCRHGQ